MIKRRLDRPRPLAMVLALALPVLCGGPIPPGGATPAVAQTRGTASPTMAPFTSTRTIQDALGFQWDVNVQGIVQQGSNCFNAAGQLTVNNSSYSPTTGLMSTDGTKFLLNWTASGVQVTRRVRIDVRTGTVRYLESFTNPGGGPVTLSVLIRAGMRSSSSLASVFTDSGRLISTGSNSQIYASRGPATSRIASRMPPQPLPGFPTPPTAASGSTNVPVLEEKECGLVVTRTSTSYPAALIYMAAPGSKVKPLLRRSSYRFYYTYTVTVPPKKTVSVLHGLAQRKISGTPDPKSLAKMFRPFQSSQWTADLPAELQGTIINAAGGYYADEPPHGPVLQEVMNLAAVFNVERSDGSDVLVEDQQSRISGDVRGSGLTVHTRFGKTSVPLEHVAALIGGEGVGRAMQLHLRNGEILTGAIETEQLTLESEAGLEIELTPEHVNALLMNVDPADGKPPERTLALLRTHHGDQLAIAGDSLPKIAAVTAWGPIEVPLAEIDYLYPTRAPQPIHRLVTSNQSRLSVILRGGEAELGRIEFQTVRFGPVKVAPGEIARLAGIEATGRAENHGEDGPEEDDGSLNAPHCRLAGGNLVVGSVAAARLELVTASGVTPLDTRLLRLIQRQDDDRDPGNPAFTFELADGTTVTGRFRDRFFPIPLLGKVFNVPAYHLVSFRQPEQTAVASPDEGVSEGEPAASADGDAAGATPEGPDNPFADPLPEAPAAVSSPAKKPPTVAPPIVDPPSVPPPPAGPDPFKP